MLVPRAFKVGQDAPRGPVFIALPSNVIDQQADLRLPGPSTAYRRNRPDLRALLPPPRCWRRRGTLCLSVVMASPRTGAGGIGRDRRTTSAGVEHGAVWCVQLSHTHPQYRGELPGEHAAMRRALGAADVVLAVGAELFDEVFYTADDPPRRGPDPGG